MDEQDRIRKREQLLDSLKASGMTVHPVDAMGFGFSAASGQDNMLKKLEEALQNEPNADSVFVFSDFDKQSSLDETDEPGYKRLRNLTGDSGRRLYLGTVSERPSAELLRIALESGGDVIVAK